MVDSPPQRRFRYSIRSLMIAVAVFALVLAPILWTVQQQRFLALEQRRAVEAELRARFAAARAQAKANEMLAQVSADRWEAETVKTMAPPASEPASGKTSPLWAALSVNHPVFSGDEVKDLVVEFTIVNDGLQPINPGIAGSRLMINGKEAGDSALIPGNGSREARFTSLPPGDHLRFTSRLGDHFRVPGTYRISWRSSEFQAPEISFRVLPARTP